MIDSVIEIRIENVWVSEGGKEKAWWEELLQSRQLSESNKARRGVKETLPGRREV